MKKLLLLLILLPQLVLSQNLNIDFTLNGNICKLESEIGFFIGNFTPNEDDNTFRLITGNGENDTNNENFIIQEDYLGKPCLLSNRIFTSDDNKKQYIFAEIENSSGEKLQKAFVIYLTIGNKPACIELDKYDITETIEATGEVTSLKLITDGTGNSAFDFESGDGINDRDNEKFVLEGEKLKSIDAINNESQKIFNLFIKGTEDQNIITDPTIFSGIDGYRITIEDFYKLLSQKNEYHSEKISNIYGPYYDYGFDNYIRLFWTLQQLPTDEALCSWGDRGIVDLNNHIWDETLDYSTCFYKHIFYYIFYSNEIITITNSVNDSGFSAEEIEERNNIIGEVKFLRAWAYWNLLDIFGAAPILTENYKTGNSLPEKSTSIELFTYIEKELLSAIDFLNPSSEYGRVNKITAKMLLARMYLNSIVYTGNAKNSEALSYAESIIKSGEYSLDSNYSHLFLADNHTSSEIIFPIENNGAETSSYGNTTFIIYGSIGSDMVPIGTNGGWGGLKAINKLPLAFNLQESDFSSDNSGTPLDSRAMFHFTPGLWSWSVLNINIFHHGIGVTKFKNINKDGTIPESTNFLETDFPLFRLGEVYLIAAEAAFYNGNLDATVSYINILRNRAGVEPITVNNLTLDFILDERMRELYWEAHRRTDLIRFDKFTGGEYLWEWKGGTQEGTSISSAKKLYLAPLTDLPDNTITQEIVINNKIEAPTIIDDIKQVGVLINNPVYNTLKIFGTNQIEAVRIINITGQLILEDFSTNSEIDVSTLKAGIYLVELKTEFGIKKFKFIKK